MPNHNSELDISTGSFLSFIIYDKDKRKSIKMDETKINYDFRYRNYYND